MAKYIVSASLLSEDKVKEILAEATNEDALLICYKAGEKVEIETLVYYISAPSKMNEIKAREISSKEKFLVALGTMLGEDAEFITVLDKNLDVPADIKKEYNIKSIQVKKSAKAVKKTATKREKKAPTVKEEASEKDIPAPKTVKVTKPISEKPVPKDFMQKPVEPVAPKENPIDSPKHKETSWGKKKEVGKAPSVANGNDMHIFEKMLDLKPEIVEFNGTTEEMIRAIGDVMIAARDNGENLQTGIGKLFGSHGNEVYKKLQEKYSLLLTLLRSAKE